MGHEGKLARDEIENETLDRGILYTMGWNYEGKMMGQGFDRSTVFIIQWGQGKGGRRG